VRGGAREVEKTRPALSAGNAERRASLYSLPSLLLLARQRLSMYTSEADHAKQA
jgi:hypothetical protein